MVNFSCKKVINLVHLFIYGVNRDVIVCLSSVLV